MPTSSFIPSNGRVFWACQAVLFKKRQTTKTGGDEDPSDSTLLHGVQSVGVDSSFSRESYADMGRFQRKFGSYGKQEFSITIERVLDGNSSAEGRGKPFYFPSAAPANYINAHVLAPNNIGADGFGGSLRNFDITLLYGGDSFRYMGSGLDDPADVPGYNPKPPNWESAKSPPPSYSNPQADAKDVVSQTTYRCCLLTEVSYTIPVDGPITESLTFTTNVATHNDNTSLSSFSALEDYPVGTNVDGSLVLRRHDIDSSSWKLPTQVERMFDWGQTKRGGRRGEVVAIPVIGLQTIELGMQIDYTDLFDEGEFGGARGDRAKINLMKQVSLPVAVTASFTGIARDQYYGEEAWQWELTDQNFSMMDGSEMGDINKYKVDEEIAIYTKTKAIGGSWMYMNWLLGKKNYLTDLSFSGGDTGGGHVEATLSYQNDFSDFVTFQGTTKYSNPTSALVY